MKKNNKISIFILLILITATAITRGVGFNNPHHFTFDEILYARLGLQLKEDPINYTSQPTYKYYTSRGRPLPDYLNRPLFKHPPLYSYLISLTYYFTKKPTLKNAWSISLISGVSLILLVYFLGKILYDQKVALIAALLLFIDPIHWLCTQKIWMETTIVAFIWLSLFFVIKATRENNYKYFYWAGIATGCAILTKYTGFIIFPVGLTLIFIHNRSAIKSKHFWSWPLISFLFFIPWLFWNYKIYGSNFLMEMINAHGEIKWRLHQLGINWSFWILTSLVVIAIFVFFRNQSRRNTHLYFLKSIKFRTVMISIPLLLLFTRPYMIQGLINMLNLSHVPTSGWRIGMFAQEPWYFYLRRLLEFSPFYIFSFGSILFLVNPKESDKSLITASIWILAFAIIWGNYQSRYILAAVPALLLISSRAIIWIGTNLKEWTNSKMRLLIYRIVFVYVLLMFLSKTVFVDLLLALPNKACYF